MLTQKRLLNVVDYNEYTGIFIWLVSNSNVVKIGDIAGTKRNGYLSFDIDGKRYKAHRLAWLYIHGRFPHDQLDHKDHDRLNNRINNLQEVTNQGNSRNSSMSKKNTSGFTGVWWDKSRDKWAAEIMIDGKKVFLGRFIYKGHAIKARKKANKEYKFHENHGK